MARTARLTALVMAAGLAAACSSGSSGGSAGAPSGSTPAPGTTVSKSAVVDDVAVDAVLHHVLTGLRAATSITPNTTIATTAASLQRASNDLQLAGNGLNPAPAGVPSVTFTPVSTGLLRVSELLHVSASCLLTQSKAATPDTKPCLPPLRKAEAKDAALAHGLISLAVYSTTPVKSFESQLVNALHGH